MRENIKNLGQRKKCKTCQYRADDRYRGCHYLLLTGKRRGCSADKCTVYIKGPKLKKKNVLSLQEEETYEY